MAVGKGVVQFYSIYFLSVKTVFFSSPEIRNTECACIISRYNFTESKEHAHLSNIGLYFSQAKYTSLKSENYNLWQGRWADSVMITINYTTTINQMKATG